MNLLNFSASEKLYKVLLFKVCTRITMQIGSGLFGRLGNFIDSEHKISTVNGAMMSVASLVLKHVEVTGSNVS